MENENMIPETEVQDKKAAKKALKEEKKAEKARKKEEKRRQNLEKAGVTPEEIEKAMDYESEYEDGGSRLAVFFVTLAIIVIWLAILTLLIKMDVGGFGSTVLQPILKDVPYINKILPKEEGDDVDITENTEYPYSTLEDAVARIKELEIELQNERNAAAEQQTRISDLEEQSIQLEQYKAEEAAFEELKQKFDEEVVFSDEAPDINEYKTFYESIDPANAEVLYKQVVGQQQAEKKMEEYVKMYSEMKPKQAAAIFDTMTNDLELVAKILESMDSESSASILGAMNEETAAKLTKLMEPSES